MTRYSLVLNILILFICFYAPAFAEEEAAPKAQAAEEVDISSLEDDYWRPNKDELEVIQGRRFEKKGRFEFSILYGIYQGREYVSSKASGLAGTYYWSNEWASEVMALKVNNTNSDFLNSVRTQYGFTPDFNREAAQYSTSLLWIPIYAKFSLLGKKISHFEMYMGPGVGITKTTADHTTLLFTVGQKYFITENLVLRIDWKMSQYNDRIAATQGAFSTANGGPGFFDQRITRHNFLFGLGWIFK